MGCATVETRFTAYPNEVETLFPSTQLATENAEDMEYEGGSGGGCGLAIIGIVQFGTAIASDVLLLPMDLYHVRKKAAEERRKKEEFIQRLTANH